MTTPPAGALSIFNQTVPTGTYAPTDPHDTNPYTMGVEFYVTSAATIYGVWYYSGSWAPSLPGAINLWTVTGSSTGTLIRSDVITWSGAVGSGWVYAPFATPVALAANTRYKAGVTNSTTGDWYASTHLYWDTSTAGSPGGNDLTNGILVAPGSANATGHAQGTFYASGVTNYPNTGFQNSNYWVDVAVVSNGAGLIEHTLSVPVACNVLHGLTLARTIEVNVGAPYQGNIRNLATDRWFPMYPS